jgi:ssDNA-binding Zn-finger/Zn-ribbon topoisomerase 1
MELKHGKRTGIHCTECGEGLMTVRLNSKTDEWFLGCSCYPDCKHTQNLPEHLRMQAMGQTPLFDIDED